MRIRWTSQCIELDKANLTGPPANTHTKPVNPRTPRQFSAMTAFVGERDLVPLRLPFQFPVEKIDGIPSKSTCHPAAQSPLSLSITRGGREPASLQVSSQQKHHSSRPRPGCPPRSIEGSIEGKNFPPLSKVALRNVESSRWKAESKKPDIPFVHDMTKTRRRLNCSNFKGLP